MKFVLIAVMFAFVVAPAFADNGNHYGWDNPNNPHYQGAPGPIAGAGLPILAVGYGVYWLVKRRRKKTD